jgi:hypothetical protein
MNSLLTLDEIFNLTDIITSICEGILFRNGPFLKEGVYQDLLVHELQLRTMHPSRELVFPYQLRDLEGDSILIGNSQSLRSDIELPSFQAILELKSSGSNTKDENIFQLRNYLENREDRSWGLLINFVSKFTQNSGPKVQVTLLLKGNADQTIRCVDASGKEYFINQYYRRDYETQSYPRLVDCFMSFENINSSDNSFISHLENDSENTLVPNHLQVESGILNLN